MSAPAERWAWVEKLIERAYNSLLSYVKLEDYKAERPEPKPYNSLLSYVSSSASAASA